MEMPALTDATAATNTLLRTGTLAAALLGLLFAVGCPDAQDDDASGQPPDDDDVADDDATGDDDDDVSDDDTADDDTADDDTTDCEDVIPQEGDPLAAMGNCGVLVYAPYANRDEAAADNHLPDFSHAGYEGGGVAIPQVATQITVDPESGDDHDRIQDAIDAVSALSPDGNGFRGAVLLTAGSYTSSEPIRIQTSGVVLRGEGQGTSGTVITATASSQIVLVEVVGDGGVDTVDGSTQRIVTGTVPVGSRTFEVEDASGYSPGDTVAVRRTPNGDWIDDIGMDAYGWDEGSFDIVHERVLTSVDTATGVVEIDVPIVDGMSDAHGGGQLELLDTSDRIHHVGIEDLRLDSEYDGSEDEDHAWTGILLEDVEDAWVRRVTALHFGREAVKVDGDSHRITVEDCAMLDPISEITGNRRYPFSVDSGGGVLFQRLYAREGRHSFVSGSRVAGPVVWLDCLAEDCHADDGPHQKWATGLLFDNTRSAELRVQNRQDSGSGHGWAGAQVMFWNSEVSDHFVCDAPPHAMNYAVGVVGDLGEGQWAPEEPPGIHESLGTPVEPRSLYLQQLQDRIGLVAVEAVAVPAQLQGTIWVQLADWAGDGPPSW